jgi:hypothetical protein
MHELPACELALQLLHAVLPQRRLIPQPQPRQPLGKFLVHLDIEPLARQQALDAVDVLGLFVLEGQEFTPQLPLIFLGHCRHAHDAPNLFLAVVVTHQQAQQLAGIDAIRLGPPLPPVYLDR